MTNTVRPTVSSGFRLPLALTAAAIMVTGSAAMAWPVLKSAFGPSVSSQAATAPVDPAAVSGFVEGTRAQMTASPAVADSTDLADPVLVRIPNLMLDRNALRQPRPVQDSLPVPEPVTPLQQVQQPETRPDQQPQVHVAQVQTPRPLTRPVELTDTHGDQADRAQVITPAPDRVDQNSAPQVVPVATQQSAPQSAPSASSPARLNNVWMTGAFR